VACALAAAGLTAHGLFVGNADRWNDPIAQAGPVVTLFAAVGTALAAYLLYAPRRVASSAITAS
jgi:hypothetical protein